MRVYIWCDGAAMPNGGPAGAGYVVVGGVHLLGSEALGDATNNVAEYMAVRNALRAAADAGATSAHVRMDSPVVFGHLSGTSRARAERLIQLKEEVEAQVARYPGRVTFAARTSDWASIHECPPRPDCLGPATVGVDDPHGGNRKAPRPNESACRRSDRVGGGSDRPARAGAGGRCCDARARRRTEAHADGAGRARLRLRGP